MSKIAQDWNEGLSDEELKRETARRLAAFVQAARNTLHDGDTLVQINPGEEGASP